MDGSKTMQRLLKQYCGAAKDTTATAAAITTNANTTNQYQKARNEIITLYISCACNWCRRLQSFEIILGANVLLKIPKGCAIRMHEASTKQDEESVFTFRIPLPIVEFGIVLLCKLLHFFDRCDSLFTSARGKKRVSV